MTQHSGSATNQVSDFIKCPGNLSYRNGISFLSTYQMGKLVIL